jgi:hypothetical protein
MEKVQKPSNSVCYTPSSEPYRIYMTIVFWSMYLCIWLSFCLSVNQSVHTSILNKVEDTNVLPPLGRDQ